MRRGRGLVANYFPNTGSIRHIWVLAAESKSHDVREDAEMLFALAADNVYVQSPMFTGRIFILETGSQGTRHDANVCDAVTPQSKGVQASNTN
jgi:hypothetical protein